MRSLIAEDKNKEKSSLMCKADIHPIPGDWQSVKKIVVNPNHPFNILSPSINVSDFVFQLRPALSCRVAISVDRLRHSCQLILITVLLL